MTECNKYVIIIIIIIIITIWARKYKAAQAEDIEEK